MVFNKLDELEVRGLVSALRTEYVHATFVSALRGIGLDDLRRQVLNLIEAEYVEQEALLPVAEAKSRAHVHRLRLGSVRMVSLRI